MSLFLAFFLLSSSLICCECYKLDKVAAFTAVANFSNEAYPYNLSPLPSMISEENFVEEGYVCRIDHPSEFEHECKNRRITDNWIILTRGDLTEDFLSFMKKEHISSLIISSSSSIIFSHKASDYGIRSIYRASDKNIMHIPSNIQCTLTYQVTYLCADVVSIVPYWLNLALSFVSGIASILWFLSLSTVNRTQVRTVHVYLMLVCFGVFFHQMVSMVYKLSCPWQNSKERLSYEEVLAYSKFFTDLLFLLLLLFLTNGVYVCVEQAKLILYVSCAITLVSTPSLLSIQMEDYNWFHICTVTTLHVYVLICGLVHSAKILKKLIHFYEVMNIEYEIRRQIRKKMSIMRIVIGSIIGFTGGQLYQLLIPLVINNIWHTEITELLLNCGKTGLIILICVKLDPYDYTQKFINCSLEYLYKKRGRYYVVSAKGSSTIGQEVIVAFPREGEEVGLSPERCALGTLIFPKGPDFAI